MSNGNDMAYPLVAVTPHGDMQISYGLSKREAFAMAAMQGLMARADMPSHERAEYAVACADDLLAALEKSP